MSAIDYTVLSHYNFLLYYSPVTRAFIYIAPLIKIYCEEVFGFATSDRLSYIDDYSSSKF
jgi:hypothetical protein